MYISKYKKVGVLPIRIVKSNVSSVSNRNYSYRQNTNLFIFSVELYLYTAYAAHYIRIYHFSVC